MSILCVYMYIKLKNKNKNKHEFRYATISWKLPFIYIFLYFRRDVAING